MSEIKPVYQVRVRFNLWEDQTKEQYEDSKFGDGVPRILYPAAAYEALQKENEAQAKRIAGLEEDLQFVERWANHHGTKPNVTAQEALSCIQHYPSIAEITKSYKDGVIPSTRNPYAEIEALRKQLKRDEILRETQTNEGSCSVACDQYPNCICPKNGDSK